VSLPLAGVPVVVLDSKVLLLAYAFPGGSASELLDRAIARQITAVVSLGTLSEFARILTGPAFSLPARLVEGWVRDLREICEAAPDQQPVRMARPRLAREDGELISCAAAVAAESIVTGERSRLLRLGRYRGIEIAGPATVLRGLGLGPPSS
jgi:predicted nucleic acid-binding protein